MLLYEWEIKRGEDSNIQRTLLQTIEPPPLSEDDSEYIDRVYQGVCRHAAQLDERITANAIGWKITRLPRVDLTILRIGAYELLHTPDIPDAVTINECVELAKQFSTAESGAFVNGMLSAIRKAAVENAPAT